MLRTRCKPGLGGKASARLDSCCPQLSPSASLNYLSLVLPPNCSTPVGRSDVEAGGHCCGKIGGCCVLRSL